MLHRGVKPWIGDARLRDVASARIVVGVEDLPPHDDVQPAPESGPGPARRSARIAITLVLVAAMVVVAGLEGSGFIIRAEPDVRPAPSTPTVPRIALVDADGALRSIDADGGSLVGYPAPGVIFQFPAWSPDGTRIAAIGTDDGNAGIYVFAAATDAANGSEASAPTIVYRSPDHPAFYLYWAPDSGALAFLTTEPDGIALRHAPADARAPDTIVRNGAPMYWQWVDATRLLVHSGGDSPDAFVGEVGLDGSLVEPSAIQAGSFRAPGVSGSGEYLAYATAGSDGSAAVVVESRDGATRHEVPVFGVAALEFDPVGDTLAFVAADRVGNAAQFPVGPLRTVDPASGAVRTLLSGSVVAFFWAPDGRTIVALRLNGPADNNVASRADAVGSLARSGASQATPAAQAAQAAQTAAGTLIRVAFVDVASGSIRSERVGRLSDGFLNQILPYFDQYALSHRFWSPDGSSIVLPLDDGQGVSQLTVIPADGSDGRQLTAGVLGTWSP